MMGSATQHTGLHYNKLWVPLRVDSNTMGALGPMSIATAPAPPVARAFPLAYTAMSPATTIPYRPSHAQLWARMKV